MGEGMLQICCMLLTLIDALASDWSVDLPSGPICAVVGSSMVIPCSYDYPRRKAEEVQPLHSSIKGGGGGGIEEEEEHKVLSEMWCRGDSRCLTQSYVFHSAGIFPDPSFQNRVEYYGQPGYQNCSLKISDLREADSGTYVFYLITSHPTQKMPEQSGIQLLVAGSPNAVAVSVSPCGDITEGMSLHLSCCRPSANPESRYEWHKNALTLPGHLGHVLTMTDVKAADTGTYYCSNEVYRSTDLVLNVQYPPRNTTVSVILDEELPEGVGAAALICRSDANPPVHTYTWYKGSRCVTTPNIQQGTRTLDPPCGTGQRLMITNISKAVPTQYCCVANNRHGSQSFTVTVNIDTAKSNATEDHKGQRGVIVGVTIAALAVLSGIVAFIIYRKRKSASSHTSYALTETSSPEP